MTVFEELEGCTSRILVDKDDDCKRLGIKKPLFICAPMVKYSKLPFRKLVKLYGVDLAYTPMIYAENFVSSAACRANEFTTDDTDNPIVQFAAKTPVDFANAAELVYGQAAGIDLNCGCPMKDVRQEGYGSKLLDDPELISDIVKQTRARIPDPDFTVSTKIRIMYPIERTVDMCRKIEAAGVDHIAVHGRTVSMRKESPDYEAVKLIKSSLQVPVFANGGCKSYEDALNIAALTGADGVMAAEGLLDNPALFAGHPKTPIICIKDWFKLYTEVEQNPLIFKRHFLFMSHGLVKKRQRIDFNSITAPSEIVDMFSKLMLA